MQRSRTLPVWLVAAGILACVAQQATPIVAAESPVEVGKRWALLIGVNDYVALRPLEHCVDDMQALRDQLVACGFPEDQVYLLRDKAENAALLPTKRNIERQLALLLSLVKENDLVFVAFSGHGVQLGDKSYWCPTEAEIKDATGDAESAETLVALDGVYRQLEQCPAALRLVVVDACRNDPRRGKTAGAPLSTDGLIKSLENPPEGILVLNSCGKDERSQEDPQLKHGVFTHYLLEGLKGQADRDADRRISLGELWEFAGERTQKHVADRFHDFQRPKLKGELTAATLRFPITPIPLTPEPAVAPFDGATAKKHQLDWARHVGSPVDFANSIGMKLVLIPAGEFLMGTPESDGDDWNEHERPQHRVRITKPFYLGTYEVTQGQFAQFASDTGYRTDAEKDGEGGEGYDAANNNIIFGNPRYNWRSTGWSQTDDHPVVNVSWNDAQEFCRWLSRKEGKTYRLPTEAEWEYACRAGTTTKWNHGNDPEGLAVVGNVADHSFHAKALQEGKFDRGIESDDGYVFTSAVGRFRPNAWGLYDMHGNACEWCADGFYELSYSSSRTDDPVEPSEDSYDGVVFRGGCWLRPEHQSRSAHREGLQPEANSLELGFRVALVP